SCRIPTELAIQLAVPGDVLRLGVQRPVRGVVGHVQKERLRGVLPLDEVDGKVRDEVRLILAVGVGDFLAVAVKRRVVYSIKIVTRSLMAAAAEKMVNV